MLNEKCTFVKSGRIYDHFCKNKMADLLVKMAYFTNNHKICKP